MHQHAILLFLEMANSDGIWIFRHHWISKHEAGNAVLANSIIILLFLPLISLRLKLFILFKRRLRHDFPFLDHKLGIAHANGPLQL